MATPEEWRARGAVAIQRLLETELAVTVPEMEAKLSERRAGPADGRVVVQPHHLTTARRRLLRAGIIEQSKESTRGSGRTFTTLSLASGGKRAERAAARKRLLSARYMSWTTKAAEWGDAAPIPTALERVVHASLLEAAPHGYRLVKPGGGEVDRLFKERVPGGPLDNAAFYTGTDADDMPTTPVVVPIEAKNLRQWIYPRTQEMFQLLDKSARLQQGHPAARIAPVLVCRQVHSLTGTMAKQMGFHVIPTWRQYVRPVVTRFDETAQRKFDEVRVELGYNLEAHESSVEQMVNQFTTVLPRRIEDASRRWGIVCGNATVVDLLHELRSEDLEIDERHETLAQLGQAVGESLGEDVGWAGEPHGDDADEPERDYERDRGDDLPF